jgi:hypothetical protein
VRLLAAAIGRFPGDHRRIPIDTTPAHRHVSAFEGSVCWVVGAGSYVGGEDSVGIAVELFSGLGVDLRLLLP